MTVYMVEINEGMQANLLFLVISIFLAIHYFNSPYYKRSLNKLNLAAMSVLTLFSFSRVLIRSSELGGSNETESVSNDEESVSLLGSFTG